MNVVEVDAICVSYVNKLIERLHLGIPHLKFVQQIDVAYLVEIHCRLVGLNFSEYTANPERPSKDIEDIILSLQDRYGANNFQHLNATLISEKNPKHMLCLLQIFNEIYEYYERKGHSFTNQVYHESTLLDNSHQNTTAGDNSVVETEQSENEGSSSANMTASSSGTFEEHVFHIPFSDSELDEDTGVWESFDRSNTQNESGPPPATVTSNGYLGETEDTPQQRKAKTKAPASEEKRPTRTELIKSQSRSKSSKTKLSTGFPTVAGNPSARDHDEKDGSSPDDPLLQLNDIHDEIQTHIRKQLSKMEQEISSLKQGSPSQGRKKQCCDDSPGSQNSKRTKESQPQRYDYFGNPIKERFPMYTSSIIKPICHTSYPARTGLSKPSWHNLDALDSQDVDENDDNRKKIARRSKAESKLSSTLCNEILKKVVQEMPECHLDHDTLKILHKKCKEHLKSVARVEFDEESIRNMVMDKLKIFVEGNKSTLAIQKKLDVAEKRRSGQLADQKLSKMLDNRRRAERSAKHGVKKQHQDARNKIQKLVIAKKVESRQIMEAFDEALQHEKKSALSLRKDKLERANMVAAQADVLLKNLQDFNTRELNNLKEEYASLSKEMGPNADQKFQEIKDAYRLNIQREINRCVDKIIQNIASIYKDV